MILQWFQRSGGQWTSSVKAEKQEWGRRGGKGEGEWR